MSRFFEVSGVLTLGNFARNSANMVGAISSQSNHFIPLARCPHRLYFVGSHFDP